VDDLYTELRRQAMDYLSCDPPQDEPDRANGLIAKGQGWAMLALAEAIHLETLSR
jgi:hypothetical protein